MALWNVGSARVQRIEEQIGVAHMPPDRYFPDLQRDVLDRHMHWLAPDHFSREKDRFVTSVHSWLIRTRRHTILVDCCAGNHKNRPWTPRFHQLDTRYLARLAEAGVAPADIDFVFCTHLHADHAGWNTMLKDGRWVPTFPNAKYLLSRGEVDYWDAGRNPAMATDARTQVYTDSVLPVIEAGQAILIEDGHQLDDEFRVHSSAGHTPGHVTVGLTSGGRRAYFCGDAIHHAIQVYEPHWNHMADEDPAQAYLSRMKLLGRCEDERALLFPVHFGAPHVVEVHGDRGGGFKPVFIEGADAG